MKMCIRWVILCLIMVFGVVIATNLQCFPSSENEEPTKDIAGSTPLASADVRPDSVKEVPVKGMVTMVDLGAKSCIPCKMMAPILKKMEEKYDGKAVIIFIDVWKHRDQAKRFGIRAIPTQIFFNKEGNEIYRHVGFMSESAIIEQLKKMGVG